MTTGWAQARRQTHSRAFVTSRTHAISAGSVKPVGLSVGASWSRGRVARFAEMLRGAESVAPHTGPEREARIPR